MRSFIGSTDNLLYIWCKYDFKVLFFYNYAKCLVNVKNRYTSIALINVNDRLKLKHNSRYLVLIKVN